MEIIKSVKWTLGNGKAIECKIKATKSVSEDVIYADGWNIPNGKKTYSNTEINIYIDDKHYKECSAPAIVEEPFYTKATINQVKSMGGYAMMAGSVVLKKEIYEEIMAAIDVAEKESETAEYLEVKAIENAKEAKKVEAGKIAKARYNNLVKNGLCPKCGTFCYGDCGK